VALEALVQPLKVYLIEQLSPAKPVEMRMFLQVRLERSAAYAEARGDLIECKIPLRSSGCSRAMFNGTIPKACVGKSSLPAHGTILQKLNTGQRDRTALIPITTVLLTSARKQQLCYSAPCP
jgi:hypothetical protein